MQRDLAFATPHVAAPPSRARVRLDRAARLSRVLRESRGLLAFSAFVLAFLWSGIGLQVHRERGQALQAAEVNLSNLSRAFAEHTAKSLEGADQAIRFIRNEYLAHPRDLDIAGYLRDKQIIGADYRLISVIGADGMVSFASQPFERVDLSDREHFRVHAKGTADRLFVSKPVRGRVSHRSSIQLTRRIDLPDGRFGGVVVVSLSPEYLTSFYRDVNLGPHGAITLVGYDGIIRARASPVGTEGAQDVSASPLFQQALREKNGTATAPSSVDHVPRVWAFRALDDYGLVVLTGMGTDDLLDGVRANQRSYLVVGALLSLIILGFTIGIVRRSMHRLELLHALEQSNAKANAASEMKSRFLASVSHELRTPLNGMLGYAELVQDGAGDADTRQYGQVIHQSATHLLGLVNTILDLAKLDSGRMGIVPARIEVAALLEDARLAASGHAASRGLRLALAIAPGAPSHVASDRRRVMQILGNLLDNAIKFTARGEVAIRARGDGHELVVEISDTGRGMTAAQVSTAFDRFTTDGVEAVHEGQGPGLGLPLANELANLLGGSIAIASAPGAGTRVTLRLPINPISFKTKP